MSKQIYLLEDLFKKDSHVIQTIFQYMPFMADLRDSKGNTVLHHAATIGNENMVRYLLSMNASIDVQNHNMMTPLMLAVESHHSATVQVLLEANADINILDSRFKSVLRLIVDHDSAASVPFRIVKLLIDKLRRTARDSEDVARTLLANDVPLFYAIIARDAEVTKIMLDHGSPIDATNRTQRLTALHAAVLFTDLDNARLLVERGANVNMRNFDGLAALGSIHFLDSDEDAQEMIRILFQEDNQWTACQDDVPMQVHSICTYGTSGVVRTLVEQNIDLSCQDMQGQTVLHYLAENENPGIFEDYLRHGRNLNVEARETSSGLTPLHRAVWYGNVPAIRWLIEAGANLNSLSATGFPPLFYAFMHGYGYCYWRRGRILEQRRKDKRIVQLLLNYGASLDAIKHHSRLTTIFEFFLLQDSPLIKPAIARVAMIEALGQPVSAKVKADIENDGAMKRHLALCRKRCAYMKKTKVSDNVTLFDLLTKSANQILCYVRNSELLSKLACMFLEDGPSSYYCQVIVERITHAIEKNANRDKALDALARIAPEACKFRTLIADLLIDYLDEGDWFVLNQVFSPAENDAGNVNNDTETPKTSILFDYLDKYDVANR